MPANSGVYRHKFFVLDTVRTVRTNTKEMIASATKAVLHPESPGCVAAKRTARSDKDMPSKFKGELGDENQMAVADIQRHLGALYVEPIGDEPEEPADGTKE